MDLRKMLLIWTQAGKRPYQKLEDLGLLEKFLSILENTEFKLTHPIYRGTWRHAQLQPGDILDYSGYPTSWSKSFEVSTSFAEGTSEPVVFKLVRDTPIKAILNTENAKIEQEIILAPEMFKVVTRENLQLRPGLNIILLTVT